MQFSKEEKNRETQLLAEIGAALFRSQVAERHLVRCLKWVFPTDGKIKIDDVQENISRFENSPHTLGKLFKILRQRVNIDPVFDDILNKFLRNRNILAHHLFEVVPFSTSVLDNEHVMRKFIREVMSQAQIVGDVFFGYYVKYGVLNENENDIHPKVNTFLRELDSKWDKKWEYLMWRKKD